MPGRKDHHRYDTTRARGEPIPDVITIEQAERYLDEDIAEARKWCAYYIDGWDELDEVRRSVLIDMAFNLGIAGVMKFKRMLRHLAEGHYVLAAREMKDSLWAKQVPRRAKELIRMMQTGEWRDRK